LLDAKTQRTGANNVADDSSSGHQEGIKTTTTELHSAGMGVLLHETFLDDGALWRATLDCDGTRCFCETEDERVEFPEAWLHQVFARYAKALESAVAHPIEALRLPSGARLVRFRFLPRYEVIAKDYLALEDDQNAPVGELAVTLARPLLHLCGLASGLAGGLA
jgi:hypothetical protein